MVLDEYFQDKNILVTGGCGFIGSHIIDSLVKHKVAEVIVVDDLSAGTTRQYIDKYTDKIQYFERDIRDDDLYGTLPRNLDMIIHLAAQPSVPVSVEQPYLDFDINVVGTLKLLEYARKNNISEFVFAASGGTVYGEAKTMPTPEFYPLRPISNYGAAKAAVEMYLKSYAELYGMKTTSMRFGNIYGPRSGHGVMFDFYHKLKENNDKLIILGNGLQEKSYLYISDCVQGFLHASSREANDFLPVNMAANPPVSVNQIADLVSNAMGLEPEYEYTGGERGWKGDVRKGELECSTLISMGWNQEVQIEDGVERYISWLESQEGVK